MGSSSQASRLAFALLVLITPVTGCGKDAGTNPATPFDGGWSGTTAQGKSFDFLVEKNAVVLAMVGYTVTGTTCNEGLVSFFFREPPDAPYPVSDGEFTFSRAGSRVTVTVAGELAEGGSATGTLGVTAHLCTGTLATTWTATRKAVADVNLTGSWNATFGSNLVPETNGSFILGQSGTALTGTYTTAGGAGGTVSGTVLGRVATFTLTQTTQGCTGTFKGHAVLMPTPEFLVFAYTGSDCLGAHTNGRGDASRS